MNESGSNQELQLNEEAEQYANKVIRLVDGYLQRKEVGNILLSTSGWELARNYSDYVDRFLNHLPSPDRSVYIPKDNIRFQSMGLRAVKKGLGVIQMVPGNRPPGLVLHSVDEYRWSEHHEVTSSSNPLVFYHYLGSESKGEYGGGGQFLTVNLTEEQLQQLAQESGAKLPKPPTPPASTSTNSRKGWQFWRKQ